MAKPDLSKIEEKMAQGNDFKITRNQYISLTGIDIPQSKYYTEKRSAVSKLSIQYGYKLEVIPEQLIFKKYEN